MTLMLAMGLAIYFLIPTNPPWLAPEPINSPSAAVVYRVMESVGKELGGGIYEASYRVIGESNPRAAMPSIHLAFTALLIFPAFKFGKKWGYLAVIYAATMGFALVYMGEQYVTDLAVGFMCAVYGWYGAGAWWDLRRRSYRGAAIPSLSPRNPSRPSRLRPERLAPGTPCFRTRPRSAVPDIAKWLGTGNVAANPHRSGQFDDAALRIVFDAKPNPGHVRIVF